MKINYILKNEDFDIKKILESGQNINYTLKDNIYSFTFKNTKIYCFTELYG